MGDIFPWKVGVWTSEGSQFKKVEEVETMSYLTKYHYGAKQSPEGYVASSGTCSGDSGGPLYVSKDDKKYVIIGILLVDLINMLT